MENLWLLRRNRATTKQIYFLVTLYICACAIHVRFFEITTNAWGEKRWSVHLKFAMVESKLPGYIPVFYSSFFPIFLNCFLFALPFLFFLYVWSFAETYFPRMEVKSGILHNNMQNWWPHGPSFYEKKWCPAVLQELGKCLPTSYLLHSDISHWQKHLWQAKTPLCSPGNGLTTKKTTNELVFIYATHLKRHIIGIIAPLYSQVRLWVFSCLLQIILSEYDSAAQKILQNKNDIHDSMNSVNMSARVSRGNSLHRNVMKCLELISGKWGDIALLHHFFVPEVSPSTVPWVYLVQPFQK